MGVAKPQDDTVQDYFTTIDSLSLTSCVAGLPNINRCVLKSFDAPKEQNLVEYTDTKPFLGIFVGYYVLPCIFSGSMM